MICNLMMIGGTYFAVQESLGLSTFTVFWLSFATILFNTYTYLTIMLASLLFGETVSLLIGSCKSIGNLLDDIEAPKAEKSPEESTAVMSASMFVTRSQIFYKGLGKTEEIFGRIMLIQFLVGLVSIVLTFYTTLTLFINLSLEEFTWKYILVSSGFIGLSTSGIIFSSFMPQITHELQMEIKELVEKLDTVPTIDEDKIRIFLEDGRECHFRKVKRHIMKKLRSFQGFSALSFFTIRRSVLTSILAQVVTYLIVLLQFKVSETGFPFNIDKSYYNTSVKP